MDPTALAQRIGANRAVMYRYMCMFAPPDSHRWHLESPAGPSARSIEPPDAAPCIAMRRDPRDDAARAQLLIEIRLLWSQERLLHSGGSGNFGHCYEAVVRAAGGARPDYIFDATDSVRHDYLSGLCGQVAMVVIARIRLHGSRLL